MKDIDELSDDERRLAHLVRMSHRREPPRRPMPTRPGTTSAAAMSPVLAPSRLFGGSSGGGRACRSRRHAGRGLAAASVVPGRGKGRRVGLRGVTTPPGAAADSPGEGRQHARPHHRRLHFLPRSRRPVVASQAAPQQPVRTQRLSTPRGMDFKVILPDGSEVWLNAESTIEFPSAFRDGLRQVRLKGRGLFPRGAQRRGALPGQHRPHERARAGHVVQHAQL